MRTTKRISFSILLGLLLCIAPSVHAQVTIGSGAEPNPGALLDLKEDGITTKGLGMPRVKLTNLASILVGDITGVTAANKDLHIGLTVYNTNKVETQASRICPGLHVWDGTAWLPLKPYPAVTETRTFKSYKFNSFTPLTLSADPMWTTLGKVAAEYPLGEVKQITDVRVGDPQTYYTSRFYVGYANVTNTYTVAGNYSCTASPVLISLDVPETKNVFEDGVWMIENLRATKLPDGTSITNSAVNSTTVAQYAHSGAGSTGTSAAAGVDTKIGLLYNWRAAMNMPIDGITTAEDGVNEGVQRQGICPAGWHLPSDRQWTDLENGIIGNMATFSSTNVVEPPLSYIGTGARGTSHGAAMKSSRVAVTGAVATSGTSKTMALGGFDALLAGFALSGSSIHLGSAGYFWSSSSDTSSTAWYRSVASGSSPVSRNFYPRGYLFSVRCKKD